MKPLVVLHSFLSIPLFVNIHVSAEEEKTSGVYINFTDCGDDTRMVKFTVSVTPLPALFSSTQFDVWLGGQIFYSAEAKKFAQNITVEHLVENLRAEFFIEHGSNNIFNILSFVNNTNLKGDNDTEWVAMEFFYALHAGMLAGLTSSVVFIPLDVSAPNNAIFYSAWKILKQASLSGIIRINLKYLETEMLCVQWNVRTEKIGIYTEFETQRHNFVEAFQTPKVRLRNNNQLLVCPPNSVENSVGDTCQCTSPRSGPYCMFQCSLDQVQLVNKPCLSEGAVACSFNYAIMCLKAYKISFLDKNITATTNNFSSIRIRWRLKNYFTMSPYIGKFEIQSINEGKYLGRIIKTFYSNEGLETEFNLTSLSHSDNENGGDDLFHLILEPFKFYELTLKLRSKSVLDSETNYVDAGTTIFETPEGVPNKPQVLEAKMTDDKSIDINWMLEEKYCPGIIRRYHFEISCPNIDSQVHENNFSVPFNCREKGSKFPHLILPLTRNCDSGTLNIKLRVATSVGYGNWSDTFPFMIPSKGMSAWAIAAICTGAFVLATLIFATVFAIYYKKNKERVKQYIGTCKLIDSLLKRPLPKPPVLEGNEGEQGSNSPWTPHSGAYDSPGSAITYEDCQFMNISPPPAISVGPSTNNYETPAFQVI